MQAVGMPSAKSNRVRAEVTSVWLLCAIWLWGVKAKAVKMRGGVPVLGMGDRSTAIVGSKWSCDRTLARTVKTNDALRAGEEIERGWQLLLLRRLLLLLF